MQMRGVHTRGGRCWRNRSQKQGCVVGLLVTPRQRFKGLFDVPWLGLAPQFENLGSCCGFWRLGPREVALYLPVGLVGEEPPLDMPPRSALIY